jgi:transposase
MTSMPHHDESSHARTDPEEVILGVDTHKDVHAAAVITVQGVGLASAEFATTGAGYRRLLAWAQGFGVLHRAGVEGTGSYGAGLTRELRRHGITVVEVNRPDRAARRRHGKTDTVDALAACAVLSGRANATAKTGDGPVEMLRMFRLARTSAVKSRTQAINQLNAVIVGADPVTRETLSGLTGAALIRHCAKRRPVNSSRRRRAGVPSRSQAGPRSLRSFPPASRFRSHLRRGGGAAVMQSM